MAAVRRFQPALRAVVRTPAVHTSKRFLNWESSPAIWTAQASVSGGREGHVTAPALNLELGMPKAAGGKGDKTNPEELFAAGYGACFQGAMGVSAPLVGVKLPSNPRDINVDTHVHLIGDIKKADIGIRVDMTIKAKGMSKEDLEKVVEKTKTVCPYSRATQGNVITNTKVEVE